MFPNDDNYRVGDASINRTAPTPAQQPAPPISATSQPTAAATQPSQNIPVGSGKQSAVVQPPAVLSAEPTARGGFYNNNGQPTPEPTGFTPPKNNAAASPSGFAGQTSTPVTPDQARGGFYNNNAQPAPAQVTRPTNPAVDAARTAANNATPTPRQAFGQLPLPEVAPVEPTRLSKLASGVRKLAPVVGKFASGAAKLTGAIGGVGVPIVTAFNDITDKTIPHDTLTDVARGFQGVGEAAANGVAAVTNPFLGAGAAVATPHIIDGIRYGVNKVFGINSKSPSQTMQEQRDATATQATPITAQPSTDTNTGNIPYTQRELDATTPTVDLAPTTVPINKTAPPPINGTGYMIGKDGVRYDMDTTTGEFNKTGADGAAQKIGNNLTIVPAGTNLLRGNQDDTSAKIVAAVKSGAITASEGVDKLKQLTDPEGYAKEQLRNQALSGNDNAANLIAGDISREQAGQTFNAHRADAANAQANAVASLGLDKEKLAIQKAANESDIALTNAKVNAINNPPQPPVFSDNALRDASTTVNTDGSETVNPAEYAKLKLTDPNKIKDFLSYYTGLQQGSPEQAAAAKKAGFSDVNQANKLLVDALEMQKGGVSNG